MNKNQPGVIGTIYPSITDPSTQKQNTLRSEIFAEFIFAIYDLIRENKLCKI